MISPDYRRAAQFLLPAFPLAALPVLKGERQRFRQSLDAVIAFLQEQGGLNLR
jgi:hypothetical protein